MSTHKPRHPGEELSDVWLPALRKSGTTTVRFAELLGLSRSRLYDLLGEKAAVTPELAVLLGKLCGPSAEYWMGLQQAWDLERAREALADRLSELPTLRSL